MAAMATAYPQIEFEQRKLKNGLQVILSVDHSMPLVAVNLWYDVGSRNEEKGKTGLAHLFEHMMFEGSANVAKGEHFKYVEASGGANNASTAEFRTNYFEWAPSEHLETLLWLEADRLGGLPNALNQKTLDNQRDVVKNERRQVMDNTPYGSWLERVSQTLFDEGHPYHHEVIGSMDDLDAASLKDVKDFFQTHYAPNNAVLTIVGDFDPVQALKWVEKYFGGIPLSNKIPTQPEVDVPLTLGGERRETRRERVSLPGVFLAYRSPGLETREHDVLVVAGAVMSLGRGSRMYQRLVKEQIALQAQFLTLPQPGVSKTVVLGISRPGVFDDILEAALLKVIDSLKSEDVTQEELARAKAQIERSFLDGITTAFQKADLLSGAAVLFKDPGKANQQLADLLSVTPAEIKKVAAEVLIPDNRSVITYLPKPPDPKKRDKRRERYGSR